MTFDPATAKPDTAFDPSTAAPEDAPPVRSVLSLAVKQNPDQAARANALGKQYGVPQDVVLRNLQDVEFQAAVDRADERLKTSPKLAAAMRKRPDIAPLAHDDIEPLAKIESSFATVAAASVGQGVLGISESIWRTPDALQRMVGYAAGQLERTGLPRNLNPVRGVQDAIRLISEGRLPVGPQLFTGTTGAADRISNATDALASDRATFGDAFADVQTLAKNADLALANAAKTGQLGQLGQAVTDPAYWSAFIAQAVPSLYVAIKSGGSLGMMGWLEGMEQAGNAADFEKRTGQKISDADFTQAVAQTAIVNAVLEKTGVDKVLGAKGKGLKGIAQAVFGEGGTEALQQVNSNLSALLAYNPDQGLLEGVVSSFMGGAGAGGAVSSAQAAADKVADLKARGDRDQGDAQKFADALNEQLKTAGSALLRERSPEQFRELMGQMSDGAVIHVDGAVLNQLAPEALAALPESVRNEIATAAAIDTTVAIPVADVLTVAPGTPLEQVLVENARMTPDAESQASAKAAAESQASVLMQQAERVMQQAADQEQARNDYETVRSMYAEQLKASGRYRPAVAETMPHFLASFFTAYGSRLGLSAVEMQARYPVRIVGEPTSGGQTVMGQGKPGEITVEGYHFSKEDRPVISTALFGTGLQGSSREEYLNAADKRLSKRAYFYADKGTGITPESGVGGRAHRAQLTNVYDSNLDPLGLKQGPGGKLGFESRVLDAGFRGYLDRLEGTQPGQVIMLGDQLIQPEILGPQSRIETGKRVPAMPQTEPQWVNYATGTPAEMQAMLERMQAKSSWQAYDMRVEGNALQYRKKAAVLNQGPRVEPATETDLDRNSSLDAARVSPRNPTGARATESGLGETRLQPTIAAMPDAMVEKTATEFLKYPNFAGLTGTPREILEQAKEHMKSNLRALMNAFPDDLYARARMWYVGGNRIARALSEEYGVPVENVALAMAALSPQKNWFENVSSGERVIDIVVMRSQEPWSPEMTAVANARGWFEDPKISKFVGDAAGKTLREMYDPSDPDAFVRMAWWVRAYDEANNPRTLSVITPEGTFIDKEFSARADGAPTPLRWGSAGEIGKAIAALIARTPEARSRIAGGAHKVRSFFNNIAAPYSPGGDVTIDTHAVAAALLRPLGGTTHEVQNVLSGGVSKDDAALGFAGIGNSSITGSVGAYGVYADAYRELAGEFSMLPREVQSITWEAVRLLFDAKGAELKRTSSETWLRFSRGEISHDQATATIFGLAGGIGRPDWSSERPAPQPAGSSYRRLPATAGSAGTLAQAGDLNGQAGNRGGRYSSGGLAPLEGAPAVAGAAGPDARLVAVAEQYAASIGVDLRRQGAYAAVDPERAARIAAAYEAMPHAPNDPAVREAYDDLIRQTTAQYLALKEAGYQFWFMDPAADPYQGNPWNAMRDLRANQSMAVFPTEAGFGTGGQVNIGLADPNGGPNIPPEAVLEALRVVGAEVEASAIFDSDTEPTLVVKLKKALTKEQGDFLSGLADQEAIAQRTDDDKGALFGPMAEKWGPFNPTYFVTPTGVRADEIANPLLQDTGITWAYGSPDGEQRPALANDLFRAVHDAFGHGLEGAGFRAQGEENAWQAHRAMFTGPALGALTSETRGQNSWLNYGPHGAANKTAKVEDTVFAEQKTGLMPEWTWTEGVVEPADGTLNQGEVVLDMRGDLEKQKRAREWARNTSAQFPRNPMNPAQRVMSFGDEDSFALFELDDSVTVPGAVEVKWVQASKQKRGIGTKAMQELQRLAAADGMALTLQPADNSSTKRSALVKFYTGLGFSPIKKRSKDMVWRPPGALAQEPQQPRGTFNPATLELVLNPNANLSTFFHETGHFFLEVLADVASQPNAPVQIVEDMNTFLKWAGIADLQTWNSLDLDGKRASHERWAESIEQYVMEGRAPSVELQPLMRRFATWLKSVYGSIKQFLASRGQAAPAGPVLGQSDDSAFPRISNFQGLSLRRATASIETSAEGVFSASTVLPGVRELNFADVTLQGEEAGLFNNPGQQKRIDDLAEKIKKNGSIEPLFVGRYQDGELYVMEGQHRARALKKLGYTSFPARIVVDESAGGSTKYLLRQDPAGSAGPPMALNDDIRRVMDRLLATDEQIAQANEVAGLVPDLEADAAAAERLNKRSMADLKWQVRARDQAIGKLRKEAVTIEKDIRQQATVEVDQTPEMRAKAALDALRVDPEHEVLVKQHKAARKEAETAARADVKAALLAENPDAKGLIKGQLLAKNRRDIDNKVDAAMIKWDQANPAPARRFSPTDADAATIADSFGFEGVDAMLQAIDAFGPRADAIDGLTQQRMLEEHGDLIDDRAIQQAANEAVHNEARARSLATELRTQREMLNPRADTGETNAKGQKITVNALVEAAKQFAAKVVGGTAVADLRGKAWQHTAAERRASKRWTEATSAGKTEEAVKAKQDQMLNHAAAKAALDAQAEVKKITEFFARVAKGNDEKVVKGGRDADIANAARAVLAAYGMETGTTKRAADYLETVKANDPDTYNAIAPMVDAAVQNAQPMNALTVDELRMLNEHIAALWYLAKRSRQSEVDGDLLDRDDLADELFARMEAIGIPNRVPGEGQAVTKAEERGLFLKQGIAFLRRVEQWAEGLDGEYGGPFLRYVFQPVKDAADRYRADRVAYRKKLQALVDNLAPVVGDSVIDAPELGYKFGTPGSTAGTAMNEILHAILHTGNPSNKRKLLLGRGWATEDAEGNLDTSRWDAFITRLANEGKLQSVHYDFVQGVWDLLEDTKPLAQKAHRDVFGRYFDEVTAESFADPWGQARRGGYVPAQVDSALVKDNALKKLAEEENASMAFAFPQPAKGFTMSRVEGYNRPLKLDLRTLSQHLDKVLLFSHMSAPVRDVRKLLTDKKVSQPLTRIQPAALESMLQPWLQRSAQQIVETPIVGSGKWARIPGLIRARAGAALMFANVSNSIQQVTGLSTAAVRVKPSHLMRAAAQYVAHPVKFSQAVWGASPYMDDRAKNEVAVMNEQMQDILIRPGVYERAQNWAMRHAYFMQTAIDNVLSPIVWSGAFNQALAEGMSDSDAIKFADSTVRQTQGSTLPEDVSRFETGPAYARAFTQFVGYFNMMANTNGTALKQIADEVGLKKGAGRAFNVVMLGFMAPIWAAEAIAVAFRGGPDDEDDDGYLDDWLAAVFGFGTIKGLLAQIPVAGQFGVAAVNRFNGNPMDDRVSLSPAISLLESSVGAPESVYKAIVEDGSAQKAVRDVATLVSVATGVPVYGLARPVGYLTGIADDRIEPTGPVDFARGLITGTASPDSKQR